jgi:hypothetical protein
MDATLLAGVDQKESRFRGYTRLVEGGGRMADESDRHEHEGSFAEGVEDVEHHPEDEKKGDFAEGVEEREHPHEGSFAEGVEDVEHYPEDEKKGDFAEGIESEG